MTAVGLVASITAPVIFAFLMEVCLRTRGYSILLSAMFHNIKGTARIKHERRRQKSPGRCFNCKFY